MEEYQNENIQPEAIQPAPELISQEQEQTAQEQIVQEQIVQEQIVQEQVVQEQTVQEQPVQLPVRPVSPFANSPYVEYYAPPQPIKKPKKVKKQKKSGKSAGLICLVLALILATNAITAWALHSQWKNEMELLRESFNEKISVIQGQNVQKPTVEDSVPILQNVSLNPGQIYEKNVNAVVAVTCYAQQTGYFQSGTYKSFGSGFIISEDGYVVSNYHVVEGATAITITMHNGNEHKAELVGYEADDDVALLKMEGNGFPCVEIGSSDELSVGDLVVAIGNPLGELTSTLTVGYVSAKDRIVSTDGTTQSMFQTDAAINSGNSGGPLFNVYGQVVGITTAKYSGTSSSGASIEGIGFAIPMDDVMGILDDLRDYGYVTSAYLGVYVRDVSADGIRDGLPAGAYVEAPIPGYCAVAAGIQAGDIITNVGGYDISSVAELTRALRKLEANQVTTVTVYRRSGEVTLSVVLDAKPVEQSQQPQVEQPQTEQPQTQPTIPMPGGDAFNDWYKDFFGNYFG